MQLIQGDCLTQLENVGDNTVDLVLVDPPYGTTKCKWDAVIPFEPMWAQLNRVAKKRAAMVFTAIQPFTSTLICSNIDAFSYTWVWCKKKAVGHLVAKRKPMTAHEDIAVFYRQAPTYNPKKIKRKKTYYSFFSTTYAENDGWGRRISCWGCAALYTHISKNCFGFFTR